MFAMRRMRPHSRSDLFVDVEQAFHDTYFEAVITTVQGGSAAAGSRRRFMWIPRATSPSEIMLIANATAVCWINPCHDQWLILSRGRHDIGIEQEIRDRYSRLGVLMRRLTSSTNSSSHGGRREVFPKRRFAADQPVRIPQPTITTAAGLPRTRHGLRAFVSSPSARPWRDCSLRPEDASSWRLPR